MKKITLCKIITFLIALIPLAFYLISYSELATNVPIHFNLSGEADTMVAKSSANVYLIFSISLIMFVGYTILFQVILSIMNKNNLKNVPLISKVLDAILLVITLTISSLLFYYTLIIRDICTFQMRIGLIIINFSLGIIFLVLGNFLPKFSNNKYSGFRTKELVSAPDKWFIWHRKIARYWIVGGLLIIICSILIWFTGIIGFTIIDVCIPLFLILIAVYQIKTAK